MYIGDTGKKGLHHLIFEVLDNSVDEAIAGYATKISVKFNTDHSVSIFDNGRGIPIDEHPEMKKPAVEVILESLHSGGKFDNKSYKISGGLHGVGLAVVNALTERLIVEITRDDKIYTQEFSRGVRVADPVIKNAPTTESGTKITFYPDNQIFDFNPVEGIFNYSTIANRLRELAFLTPEAKFEIYDKIADIREEFYYEGGIAEFITYLNKDKNPLHDKVICLSGTSEEDSVQVDIAMQWNQGYQTNILTYANTINTIEGGTHLTGFRGALTRTLNAYIEKNMQKKFKDLVLSGTDTREGLSAVISVKLPDPQFESQTKIKLGNAEARTAVSQIITEKLSTYLEENPDDAQKIVLKSINALKAREAAQKAKNLARRKSALDNARMPGKLTDCSSNEPEKCELFIVEGDSAGGPAKQGRDRTYQAILPIRGKILNVEKARLDKILQNKEIQAMIKAIGVGIEGLGEEEFNLANLRYHKIIIMCDADIDGHHIETLLLTFFFRYMRPLIDEGHLYMAVPPLYELRYKKTREYVYTDKQKEDKIKEIIKKYSLPNSDSIKIKRFKGLGEMNADELYDTTMDMKTRILKKITYEDYLEVDQIFTQLMGKEVKARKKFIIQNYNEVSSLDI